MREYIVIKKGGKYFFEVKMNKEQIKQHFYTNGKFDDNKVYKYGEEYYKLYKGHEKKILPFIKGEQYYRNNKPVDRKTNKKWCLDSFKTSVILWLHYMIPAWLNEQGFDYA